MADKKLTQLAAPEAAIASYLDELLHTATSTALQEETQTVSQQQADVQTRTQTKTETLKDGAGGVSAPAPVRVKPEPARVEPRLKTATRTASAAAPVSVAESAAEVVPDTPSPTPPVRPDWSEEPFECLIFTVAGLQLAVPLVLLGAIHRIEEDIRPIPGSPRWYMGMLRGQQQNLRVVDTAEWIMAGRVPEGARDNYRFVIRLDDSRWGLACDDVAQSFTLAPDQVRWRTARSKRPWLAGTVVEHMCALIDVRTMAELLVRAEREHHLALE